MRKFAESKCPRWFKAIAIIARCSLILVIVEFLIGAFASSFYDSHVRTDIYHGGYVYVRKMHAAYKSAESGLLLRLHTNSLGFRDSDRPLVKQQGVWDIVVIGNSFVAAHQLPERERFTSLLEGLLETAGARARVFNFGVQGQSLINHMDLALYAERIIAPDLVVIFVTAAADFHQTTLVTFRENRQITYAFRNEAVVREEKIIDSNEMLFRQARSWIYGLWLGRIAFQTYQRISLWVRNPSHAADSPSGGRCPDYFLENPDISGAHFQVARAVVADMHEKFGSRLLIVLLPTNEHVLQGSISERCNWGLGDIWLNDLAQRQDIRTLSLLSALRSGDQFMFFPVSHLNGKGHEAVAKALFPRIYP